MQPLLGQEFLSFLLSESAGRGEDEQTTSKCPVISRAWQRGCGRLGVNDLCLVTRALWWALGGGGNGGWGQIV